MGLTYEIDATAGIVLERWVGRVRIEDFAAHVGSMLGDNDAMACRGNLADLTKSEIAFTGEQLSQVAHGRIEPALRGSGRRIAILVRAPVQYGVARQFEVFTGTALEVEIFTDAAAAREWLARPQDPA